MCDVYVVVACNMSQLTMSRKYFHATFQNINSSLACKCDTAKDEFNVVTESSHSFVSCVASLYRFYPTFS